MGEKMAKAVVKWLLNDDVETSGIYEVYMYGMGQIFNNLFNILTALTIGFLFGETLVSVVYVVAFAFLRSYAGGYHASTPMRCYALTVASIIAVLLAVKYASFNPICLTSLFIMSSIVILMLTPVDTVNKRLDGIEHIHYRKKAIIAWMIENLVIIVCIMFRWVFIAEGIIVSYVILSLSLILGRVLNAKGAESNNI
jgi:accessory gene regulator B